jgi:general secretion pathway protein G
MERERGFSLVELLVVIAIIGILATVVAVNVTAHAATARITRSRADLASLSAAVETYRLQTGRYPVDLEELKGPVGPAREPLLKATPKDPWHRVYLYERKSAKSFVLRSLGGDGIEGGEGEDADLSSDDEPE